MFWIRIQGELEAAIQKSLRTRSEATLKLSDLTEQGKRVTWYAKGVIGSHNPDNMAHGTALANCLTAYARGNRLTIDYTVAKDGREIRLIATKHTESPPPNQTTPPRSAQIKPASNCNKLSTQPAPMIARPPPAKTLQYQETRVMKKLEGRTLLILPCCIDKDGKWPYRTPAPAVPNAFTKARNLIREDRPPREVPLTPREGIDPTPALWLYNGFLYRPLGDKSALHTAMEGWLDIVILSGGYGMVHAYEPIVPYEAPMPKYFDLWIQAGLHKALETYINITRPNNVISFFSNNTNSPKYRPMRSYGGMYGLGVGGVRVGGENGKYVPPPMRGGGVANGRLGHLVMEVVNNRSLIEVRDIPFRSPCWPWDYNELKSKLL